MSFLKEFKEDLTQAVNELVTDENVNKEEPAAEGVKENEMMDDEMINTLDDDLMADLDLDAISDLLGSDEPVVTEEETEQETSAEEEEVKEEEMAEEMDADININDVQEDEVIEETVASAEESWQPSVTDEDDLPSDELTEITKGTSITGNITSNGSMNIYGTIVGDVSCKGKMIITGTVRGTSHAGEIFANNSKIEGDVKSDGSVKVGNGSVIIGNVYATSAVIGGAIKGDIDVHGPVIVDATAVVQGNIKSRSVQINNGAAIEGFCSQCYADVDYQALFDDTFGAK